MRHKWLLNVMVVSWLLVLAVGAKAQENDVVMKAMRDEMARTMSQLHLAKAEKPYFVAYRIQEVNQVRVSASLGNLADSHPTRLRMLGVELRIGDYSLDNSNYFSPRNFTGGMSRMFSGIQRVPLDDNYLEIRRQLWLATDAEYKKAVEDFAGKRAALEVRKGNEELPDFSREEVSTFHQAPVSAAVNVSALEELARSVSAIFRQERGIFVSQVDILYQNNYMRYINSEGTTFTRSDPLLKLQVNAKTQAADGLPIEDSIRFWGRSVSDLPSKDELAAKARELAARLGRLRQASTVDNYNGPVLFEGDGAAEVFAQVFAPGLVAVRHPLSDDPRFGMFFDQFSRQLGGGSFQEKIGGRVLPETLDVIDDARVQQDHVSKLLGSYPVDDDGLPSRETKLVQQGILKTLLAARTPVKNIAHSTASHRGWGAVPSNLVVTSEKPLSDQDLRKQLLRRVEQRGLPYGLVIRHLGGGGLQELMRQAALVTRQSAPSATLVDVRKVFPDGHEEPVRGLQFSDMTAAMFRDIVAAGRQSVVYTDDFVPKMGTLFSMTSGTNFPVVSFVVPSLLFEEVTLTKARGPFSRPPFSNSPLFDNSETQQRR